MNTAAQTRPPRRPSGPQQFTDPSRSASARASEHRTFREMLAETGPLIECVPVEGPPVALVLGPWVFLALLLAGPCACLFALVVVIIVTAAVLAGIAGAILVAPYLLVRHLHRPRARQAPVSASAAQVVAMESPRVPA